VCDSLKVLLDVEGVVVERPKKGKINLLKEATQDSENRSVTVGRIAQSRSRNSHILKPVQAIKSSCFKKNKISHSRDEAETSKLRLQSLLPKKGLSVSKSPQIDNLDDDRSGELRTTVIKQFGSKQQAFNMKSEGNNVRLRLRFRLLISRLEVLNKAVSKNEEKNTDVMSKLRTIEAVFAKLQDENAQNDQNNSSLPEEEDPMKVKTFSLIKKPLDRPASSHFLVSQPSPSSIQLKMRARLKTESQFSALLQAHIQPLKKTFKIYCLQSFKIIRQKKEALEDQSVQTATVKCSEVAIQSQMIATRSTNKFFVTFHPSMSSLPKPRLTEEFQGYFTLSSSSKVLAAENFISSEKISKAYQISPATVNYCQKKSHCSQSNEKIGVEKRQVAIYDFDSFFHKNSASKVDNLQTHNALETLLSEIRSVREKINDIGIFVNQSKSSFVASMNKMRHERLNLINELTARKSQLELANSELTKVTGLNSFLAESIALINIKELIRRRCKVAFEAIRISPSHQNKYTRVIEDCYKYTYVTDAKLPKESHISLYSLLIPNQKAECIPVKTAEWKLANVLLFEKRSIKEIKNRVIQCSLVKQQLKTQRKGFAIEPANQYRHCDKIFPKVNPDKSLSSMLVFKKDKNAFLKTRDISQVSSFHQLRRKSANDLSECFAFIQPSKPHVKKSFESMSRPIRLACQNKALKMSPLNIDGSETLFFKASRTKSKLSSVTQPVRLLNQRSINRDNTLASVKLKTLIFNPSTKQSRIIGIDDRMCFFFKYKASEVKCRVGFSIQSVFSFTSSKQQSIAIRQVFSAYSTNWQNSQPTGETTTGQKQSVSEEKALQFPFSECKCDCALAASKFEIENKKMAAIFYIRDLNAQNELARLRKKIDSFKSEPSISHTLKEINLILTNEKQALEAKLMIMLAENPDLSGRFNREVERDNINLRSLLATAEDRIAKLEKKLAKSKKKQVKLNSKLEGLLPLIKIVIEQVFLENAKSFASVFDVCTSKKVFDVEIEQLTKQILLSLENARRVDRLLYSPNGVLKNQKNIHEASSAWLLVISERQRNLQLTREKKELQDVIAERVN